MLSEMPSLMESAFILALALMLFGVPKLLRFARQMWNLATAASQKEPKSEPHV